MRRWAFVTNAPAHALALIANLYALAAPDERWVCLLIGGVFIANTFTASTTTSKALTGLVESRMAAARANLAKSPCIARMGLEIRTPLNGVLGVADLMAMEGVAAEQQAHLQLIRPSGLAAEPQAVRTKDPLARVTWAGLKRRRRVADTLRALCLPTGGRECRGCPVNLANAHLCSGP